MEKKRNFFIEIRTLLRTALTVIKSNPLWVLLRILRFTYSAVASLIPAYVISLVINELTEDTFTRDTLYYIIVYTCVGLVSALVDLVFEHFDMIVNHRISRNVNRGLNEAIMNMPYHRMEEPRIREFISLAKNANENNLRGVTGIVNHLFYLIDAIVKFIIYISVITALDTILIIIISICVIMRFVFNALRLRAARTGKYDRKKQSANAVYMMRTIENNRSAKELRILNLGGWFLDKWEKCCKLADHGALAYNRLFCFTRFADESIGHAESFFAYLFIGLKVLSGVITVGDFYFYFNCANQFADSLSCISQQFSGLTMGIETMREYNTCIEENKQLLKSEKIKEKCAEGFRLEFEDVYFHYPHSDVNILSGISFIIENGEKVTFVGENGAGKSTVMKLICRFYQPTSGRILFNGRDVSEYDLYDYYDKIGAIFQDFKIYAFSVSDNIALGGDGRRVEELCEEAGLGERIKELPDGIDTFISKEFDSRGVEFSGGEKQKLALARMLAKAPSLLILDEPTASLDPIAESEVYRSINNITENRTAVFVSHRLSCSMFVDRVLVLDGGRIVESGSHDELMKKGGKYCEMFTSQAQWYRTK